MARLHVTTAGPTTITVDGRDLIAFGGCNYLGLSHHPQVIAALTDGAARYGISTTASRETTGNTQAHDDLERDLARWMGQQSAILAAEGYTANIALAQALARTHGVALMDARAHRSLRSAATAAGMQVFEYEHLNADAAASLAAMFADQGVAILTDGVFAADGAIAPLPDLLAALPPQRATLVVDDCHGVCVLGERGSGTVEHYGLRDPRIVITTTLAKGVGCYGGAIIGPRTVVDAVREYADVYRRSTPVPPPLACAARAAVALVQNDPALLASLRRNTDHLRDGLRDLGLCHRSDDVPIFTFTLDPAERMNDMAADLVRLGLYAPCIEYPGGPAERFFRLTVSAAHQPSQIDQLLGGLAQVSRLSLAATPDALALPKS
ncbi:MAG: pyridoxal phosphate-dependent aminotransferase family protein [Planctomycetota bacterium]|nr:pyridoxal phosphate-dependent aminotransferase family protein [Planctomycetota bacterium]